MEGKYLSRYNRQHPNRSTTFWSAMTHTYADTHTYTSIHINTPFHLYIIIPPNILCVLVVMTYSCYLQKWKWYKISCQIHLSVLYTLSLGYHSTLTQHCRHCYWYTYFLFFTIYIYINIIIYQKLASHGPPPTHPKLPLNKIN